MIHPMRHFGILVVVFLLGCTSGVTEPLTFDPSTVGGLASDARAKLFIPAKQGPFPAVIVLHGCDGVTRHVRIWAQQLVEWDYVAIVVDSFRPRNVTTVCNYGMLVPPQLQAMDAFNGRSTCAPGPKSAASRLG